jgi:hypothetical protein
VFRAYEKRKLSKYYLSIREMPEVKWPKIYSTLSLEPLSKTGKLCRRAGKVYDKLSDEISDEFGVSENLKKILNNLIQIEALYEKMFRTGDRSRQAFIEVLEIKNEELQGKHQEVDLDECLYYFEQEGIKRNADTITVYEFYKCYKHLEKKAKTAERINRK